MSELILADDATGEDLRRYLTLARQVDAEAAVRLQAAGRVLAAYVGILPGHGLTGAGTVLGLRTLALSEPSDLDITVPAAAVLDRLARPVSAGQARTLPIPPMTAFVAWAAITPPRGDWSPLAQLPASEVMALARAGIDVLGAQGNAMAAALEKARTQVWGEPIPGSGGAPAGLAFAAYALRFLAPESTVSVLRSGPWYRMTTSSGHVLAR